MTLMIVLPALWLKVKLNVVIRSTIKYFQKEDQFLTKEEWQELRQWAREKIQGDGSNHYFLEIVVNLWNSLGASFIYIQEM